MKSLTWLMVGLLGLAVWAGMGAGSADAAVIYPVSTTYPFTPNTSSTVTISIFKDGVDVTASWLPEPGQTVQIVVNGLTGAVLSLVTDATNAANPVANKKLITSAYPGRCTNFDNPSLSALGTTLTASSPDFELVLNSLTLANDLTPTDCGGMAVVQATAGGATHTFILPQDANFNGIADIWEAQFCPGGIGTQAAPCLSAAGDGDTSNNNAAVGDGFANFDEYRGFIVSGTHVRTDPTKKDFFVHLVNPQCGTDSLLGGGTTKTFVTGAALFANLNTSTAQVHLLGYTSNANNYTTNEWVDRFFQYTESGSFDYKANPSDVTTTKIAPPDDRQVNRNAVYPPVGANNTPLPQRGLRVTECLDAGTTNTFTTMGFASVGSPNGADNAIVYTQRILSYFDNTLCAITTTTQCATTPSLLSYATYQNGQATTPASISHDNLIAKAIAFYLAMEVGHSLNLTPTEEGTKKSPTLYGYHHAPGTGSNLDQAIVNKVSNSSGNTFYIPTLYNSSDLSNYVLK